MRKDWRERLERDKSLLGIKYEYFSTHISEGMEELFREKRRRERIALGADIFESKNQWVGYAGEYAFKSLLLRYQVKHTYHDREGKKNPLDFTVRGIRIDVKTKIYNQYPLEWFHVDYNEKQLRQNKEITHLVFAGYIPRHRTVHLTCWNSKEGFLDGAKSYKAGDALLMDSGVGIRTATYAFRQARISDNRSIWEMLDLFGTEEVGGYGDQEVRVRSNDQDGGGEGVSGVSPATVQGKTEPDQTDPSGEEDGGPIDGLF